MVPVFLPFLEGPEPGPEKTGKNQSKLVVTGPVPNALKRGLDWQKTGKNRTCLVTIDCSLTFYVNFKLLIINIS